MVDRGGLENRAWGNPEFDPYSLRWNPTRVWTRRPLLAGWRRKARGSTPTGSAIARSGAGTLRRLRRNMHRVRELQALSAAVLERRGEAQQERERAQSAA